MEIYNTVLYFVFIWVINTLYLRGKHVLLIKKAPIIPVICRNYIKEKNWEKLLIYIRS